MIVEGGETDANGNLIFNFTIPKSTYPGLHFLKIYNKKSGELLSTTPYFVNPDPTCKFNNIDTDGDSLPDSCDTDPTDGPLADVDGDGIQNGVDKCIVVKDAEQTDTNNDGVGDACDPTLGKNPMEGFRPLGWTPPNNPPVASISAPLVGKVDTAITVNASASADIDGTITRYEWDFGDNTAKDASASATHTYKSAGTYKIQLTVEDNLGAKSKVEHEITIEDSIPSAISIVGPSTGEKDTLLTFEASSSSELVNNLIRYEWDFGDNASKAAGIQTTHTYTQDGSYNLVLTAEDKDGKLYTNVKDIIIGQNDENKAPTAIILSPDAGHKGISITFSASQSADVDGSITSYEWDFGDNTTHATTMDVNHVYNQDGTYIVKLTVTDNKQSTNETSKNITITTNQSPSPKINSKTSVKKGTEIIFDGSASKDTDGTIVKYDWDFGDKTPHSDLIKPKHVYTKAGLYKVTLTVTDNDSSKQSTVQLVHIQENKAPKPKIKADSNAVKGKEISFDASSSKDTDGTIVKYDWDFGDKTPHSNLIKPKHVYIKAGLYKVTLTVTDNDGAKKSTSQLVNIKDNKTTKAR